MRLKSTKTAWVLPGEQTRCSTISLENDRYLKWILDLRDKGNEIAIHGAAGSSSDRQKTIRALDFYREVIGEYPPIHTNHVGNIDNIYWYDHRLMGMPALAYRAYYAVRRGGAHHHWGTNRVRDIFGRHLPRQGLLCP